MNERMVIKTAKSLNKEKYMLDKLNKQIESLQEKETALKKEFKEITQNLQNSKLKEQEMKEENTKIKQMAEEEIMKNRKDHNELTMLREMKKNLQKELNRAIQENLSAKYNLESIKENKIYNSIKNTFNVFFRKFRYKFITFPNFITCHFFKVVKYCYYFFFIYIMVNNKFL